MKTIYTIAGLTFSGLLLMGASCNLLPKTQEQSQNTNQSSTNTIQSSPTTAIDPQSFLTKNTDGTTTYNNSYAGLKYTALKDWGVVSDGIHGVISAGIALDADAKTNDGTDGTFPNGIYVSGGFLKKTDTEYILAQQRVQGTYQTAEQLQEDIEGYKESSFPRPVLRQTKKRTIAGIQGYEYTRDTLGSQKRPIRELSSAYQDIELYVQVSDDRIFTIHIRSGWGIHHDTLVADANKIIDSITVSAPTFSNSSLYRTLFDSNQYIENATVGVGLKLKQDDTSWTMYNNRETNPESTLVMSAVRPEIHHPYNTTTQEPEYVEPINEIKIYVYNKNFNLDEYAYGKIFLEKSYAGVKDMKMSEAIPENSEIVQEYDGSGSNGQFSKVIITKTTSDNIIHYRKDTFQEMGDIVISHIIETTQVQVDPSLNSEDQNRIPGFSRGAEVFYR